MTNHQRGIQTVELSGEILKLVCSSKKSLSLSEIAESLEMAPGSAYKYLISLLRTGLLKRNESTLEYEAGPLSLRLGLSKINHDSILAQSRIALTQLAEKYEINVFTSMWSAVNGPTVVFYKEFAGFFNIGFRLGINLSLTHTTTGRLFAAYQFENVEVQKVAHPFLSEVESTHLFDDQFQLELKKIREQGYSNLINTPTPGFNSFAVPVFDQSKKMILALTAFARTDEITDDQEKEILGGLQTIAQQLGGINHG